MSNQDSVQLPSAWRTFVQSVRICWEHQRALRRGWILLSMGVFLMWTPLIERIQVAGHQEEVNDKDDEVAKHKQEIDGYKNFLKDEPKILSLDERINGTIPYHINDGEDCEPSVVLSLNSNVTAGPGEDEASQLERSYRMWQRGREASAKGGERKDREQTSPGKLGILFYMFAAVGPFFTSVFILAAGISTAHRLVTLKRIRAREFITFDSTRFVRTLAAILGPVIAIISIVMLAISGEGPVKASGVFEVTFFFIFVLVVTLPIVLQLTLWFVVLRRMSLVSSLKAARQFMRGRGLSTLGESAASMLWMVLHVVLACLLYDAVESLEGFGVYAGHIALVLWLTAAVPFVLHIPLCYWAYRYEQVTRRRPDLLGDAEPLGGPVAMWGRRVAKRLGRRQLVGLAAAGVLSLVVLPFVWEGSDMSKAEDSQGMSPDKTARQKPESVSKEEAANVSERGWELRYEKLDGTNGGRHWCDAVARANNLSEQSEKVYSEVEDCKQCGFTSVKKGPGEGFRLLDRSEFEKFELTQETWLWTRSESAYTVDYFDGDGHKSGLVDKIKVKGVYLIKPVKAKLLVWREATGAAPDPLAPIDAAEISPESTSSHPEIGTSYTYYASNMLDMSADKAWCSEGNGEGVKLTFTFVESNAGGKQDTVSKPVNLHSMRVWGGYLKNSDAFEKNYRLKDFNVRLYSGEGEVAVHRFSFGDIPKGVVEQADALESKDAAKSKEAWPDAPLIEFDPVPAGITKVVLEVVSVHPDPLKNDLQDLCMSRIEFYEGADTPEPSSPQ